MSYRVLSYTSSAAEQYAVDMPSQEGISAVRDFPMNPLEWKRSSMKTDVSIILYFNARELEGGGSCDALDRVQSFLGTRHALIRVGSSTMRGAGPVAETWAGTANKPLRNRLIRVVREAPWKYGEDVQLLLRVDHEHHFEDAMRRKLVQIR